jgi:hypothetical protein
MNVLMHENNKKPEFCRSGFLDNGDWKCYAAFDSLCGKSPATCLATKISGRIHAVERAPSLPRWLHKEKSGETLISTAFLLPQISLLPPTSIKPQSVFVNSK